MNTCIINILQRIRPDNREFSRVAG